MFKVLIPGRPPHVAGDMDRVMTLRKARMKILEEVKRAKRPSKRLTPLEAYPLKVQEMVSSMSEDMRRRLGV